MSHSSYPIYLIPDPLREIINDYFLAIQDNTQDIKGKLTREKSPKKEFIPQANYISKKQLIVWLRIGKIVSYFSIGILLTLAYPNSLLMLLTLSTGLILFWIAKYTIAQEMKAYYQEKARINRLIRRQNRCASSYYNINYWQEFLDNIEPESTSISSADIASNFRQKVYHFFEQETIYGREQAEAQKGVSEPYFLKYLAKYFGDEFQIKSHYFQIPNFAYGYTTDFALIHTRSGMALDIEIDEPYDGKSKKPHHCQDARQDLRRNNFLLERNWLVIRFSEFQVISQPEACCKAIALLIFNIFQDSRFLDRFTEIESLTPDSTWTKKKATVLARQKYRESYLKDYGLFVTRNVSG